MDLKKEISEILSNVKGTFGISIKHLETEEEVNINSDKLFQMASVFKVPILAVLYEQVYKGKVDLKTRIQITAEDRVPGSGVIQEMTPGIEVTIKDLATMMIIVSDNLATDKLFKMLGVEAIQQKMSDIGLNKIKVAHSCWDLLCLSAGITPQPYSDKTFEKIVKKIYQNRYDPDNYVFREDRVNNLSTPNEMNKLLEMFYHGEFVSKECSDGIIDVMQRQQINQRIPGLLPYGTKVAHKTGSIASCINDVGIVYLPKDKGAFAISVFSVGVESDYEGAHAIARISKNVYDHFMNQK